MVERATMRRMSTTAEAPRRVGGAGLRLLARIIFGLTILGIVVGIWLSLLDPRRQGSVILTSIRSHGRPVRGHRPLPARHRGGGLLLCSRGSDQHREVRGGDDGRRYGVAGRWGAPVRRDRRRSWVRCSSDDLRHRSAGHGRSAGRDRRHIADLLVTRQRDDHPRSHPGWFGASR
jgi:hypothetical protein